MSKNSFKVTIKGIDWQVYLVPDSNYIKNHPKASEGVTYPHDREIFFMKSRFTPVTVRHEVFHAAVASSSTSSSGLDGDQVEDQCCEIYGEHGPELDLIVDKIIDHFSRRNALK